MANTKKPRKSKKKSKKGKKKKKPTTIMGMAYEEFGRYKKTTGLG